MSMFFIKTNIARITVKLFLFFTPLVVVAQDKLIIKVAAYGGGATDSLQPLWNYANQWGTYTPFTKGEGVLTGKVYYNFLDKKNISMRAGVAGVAISDQTVPVISEG
jgi:hypothetical protein